MTLNVPVGWSGRVWGRTVCTFDSSGKGKCATGDCGGTLQCNGNNAQPPATLAEFTLGKTSATQDFYDVSLVDGFNLPMIVNTKGGQGACAATGCLIDINSRCPKELQVEGNVACKSACEAFGTPEYCCSGAYGNPNTCKPSVYSQLFKTACPKSYSYAYDDASSTFTCSSADYAIVFCQTLSGQKHSSRSSPVVNATDNGGGYVAWDVSTSASPAFSAAVSVLPSSLFFLYAAALLVLVCIALYN
eukprot:TRINITY_DN1707_c0_g1_i1.p1 TRINITY_DN1707_c0_g1~~TRINITY_DN1707_c0_g1_i1.p1  ORF type:complete len:246 (-),score=-26.65 TRINITY_DN1707_c0_g1_i1:498-1235(-)